MKWPKWNVLIHLRNSDTFRLEESPRHLGIVKAKNTMEAEKKGTQLAKSRGLSGLIEVVLSPLINY